MGSLFSKSAKPGRTAKLRVSVTHYVYIWTQGSTKSRRRCPDSLELESRAVTSPMWVLGPHRSASRAVHPNHWASSLALELRSWKKRMQPKSIEPWPWCACPSPVSTFQGSLGLRLTVRSSVGKVSCLLNCLLSYGNIDVFLLYSAPVTS